MCHKNLVLGFDTSNYKTSLACTDHCGGMVIDSRKPLVVKQGERGLRQSYALFQHMDNLPEMIQSLFQQIDKNRIAGIAASNQPRPVSGSYMPVFKAGVNYGKVLAASLGVPFFEFSHQEGHLQAIKQESCLSKEEEFLAYHLSGGTTELLYIKEGCVEILGGSKDISFGQVIDRIGVALNMKFPAGPEMDRLAIIARDKNTLDQSVKPTRTRLTKIPIDGLQINLSGLETQCQRRLKDGENKETLVLELFLIMSQCLCELTKNAIVKNKCNKILFTGGVSASQFVREKIESYFHDKEAVIAFGHPALASDNAVGISLLGGKKLWR